MYFQSVYLPSIENELETTLATNGFPIKTVERIAYGRQIRLACGIVINVYDKGTVLVQGKVDQAIRMKALDLLQRLLPADTRWGV